MNSNQRTDAQFLADRFSLTELRLEAHKADIQARPDWDDFGFWCWYRDTVEQAIIIKQQTQPKPIVKPGHIDIGALKEQADIVAMMESYGVKLRKSGFDMLRHASTSLSIQAQPASFQDALTEPLPHSSGRRVSKDDTTTKMLNLTTLN